MFEPRYRSSNARCATGRLSHYHRYVTSSRNMDIGQVLSPTRMAGAVLSHHGDDCSFETMLRNYELDDG